MPSRRSSRQSSRRPPRRRGWGLQAGAVVGVLAAVALAFVGGYKFGSARNAFRGAAKDDPSQASAPSDPAARAAALDLLDQAYAARFEERPEDALALAQRARAADPRVPGVDLVVAEVAFDSRRFADLRKYAQRAVEQKQYAGEAQTLLGLEKWLTRNSADFAAASLIDDDVSRLFNLAGEENYFDPLPRFFHGDTLRESGQHDAGKRRADEAQHRLQPWHSSLLISLKAALAADEAGLPLHATDSPVTNLGARDAVLGLRAAVIEGAPETGDRATRLRGFLTIQQAKLLLSDPAFGSNASTAPTPLP